jgi:hypothetical protein
MLCVVYAVSLMQCHCDECCDTTYFQHCLILADKAKSMPLYWNGIALRHLVVKVINVVNIFNTSVYLTSVAAEDSY